MADFLDEFDPYSGAMEAVMEALRRKQGVAGAPGAGLSPMRLGAKAAAGGRVPFGGSTTAGSPDALAQALGGPPTDDERAGGLESALRGGGGGGYERGAGMLGLLTGDPVLSRLGRQLVGGDVAARKAQSYQQQLDLQQQRIEAQRARDAASAPTQEARTELIKAQTEKLRRAGKGGRGVSERDMQKLAKEVGENPALITEKLARINGMLADPKFKDDLPGVGPLASQLPEAAISDEGKQLRADARELVNVLLFMQSGAGVSNQERENKYRAYGIASGSTEASFRQGMSSLQNDLSRALESKQAGFRPEVVEEFEKRGGMTARRLKAAGKTAPAAKTPPKAAAGPRILVLPNGEEVEVDE